ncbi:MAG TPA: hypothetical protein PLM70_07950 [Bacteroidales bacterium]|nr:hypothetical protein [Candidatus Paceibacterota bacterium]HPS72172.1 hypothetical protein [Bacteroidales bacterium]
MKKLYKIQIKIILTLLFSSCIVQGLNTNYNKLSDEDLRYFVSYNSNNLFKNVDNSLQNLKIEEINSSLIKQIIKENKYVCLYSWVPFCNSIKCENLKFYSNIEKKYSQIGFHFLIISETYDIDDIKLSIMTSGYDKQLYVIKHEERKYGNNRKNVVSKFIKEITGEELQSDYYFFCDSKLIYHGIDISESIIDSILIENNK